MDFDHSDFTDDDTSPIDDQKDVDDKVKHRKQRFITTLPVHITSDIKITVDLYVLIREKTKPLPILIRKKDSEILKKEVVWKRGDTDSPVNPQYVKPAMNIAGEQVVMEEEEVTAIRNREIGFFLLGFKPKDVIKSYHFVAPGYFLYPTDTVVGGSTKLYNALHQRCLHQGVIAIVKGIIRKTSSPRLMALMPVDDDYLQGFYVFVLPFADDLRPVDIPQTCEHNDSQLRQKMAQIMDRCSREYSPDEIKNPALQHFHSYLEALALNTSDVKPVVNMTDPGYYINDETISSFVSFFKERLPKQPNPANQPDVPLAWKNGELEKLTVVSLKNFIHDNCLNIKGHKKADLIIGISSYLEKAEKD